MKSLGLRIFGARHHSNPLPQGENSPNSALRLEPRKHSERRLPDRPVAGQDWNRANQVIGAPIHGQGTAVECFLSFASIPSCWLISLHRAAESAFPSPWREERREGSRFH